MATSGFFDQHSAGRAEHMRALAAMADKYTLEPHGREWLMKALYPPGEGAAAQVPDLAYVPTVPVEYRVTKTFSKPASLPDGEPWDACVILTPGDNIAAIIGIGGATTNFLSGSGVVGTDFMSYQRRGSSEQLTGGQLSGGTLTNVTMSSWADPVDTVAFRTAYKSVTLHCTAPAIANGGTITSGQVALPWNRSSNGFLLCDRGTGADGLSALSPCAASLPLSEPELALACPGVVVDDFKEGVFMPLRLGGPSLSFQRRVESSGLLGMGAGTGPVYFMGHTTAARAVGSIPATPIQLNRAGLATGSAWFSPSMLNEASYLALDFADDNAFDSTSTGVIILRGLDHSSSFNITVRACIERVVAPNSPIAALARPPVQTDPMALEAYFRVASAMKYAYPARYNAIGAVLPLIAGALRAAAPHILSFARQALPVVAPYVAQAVFGSKTQPQKVARAAAPRPRKARRSASVSTRARSASRGRSSSLRRARTPRRRVKLRV